MRTLRHALFLGSALALAACGGGELEDADLLAADVSGQSEAPLHLSPSGRGIPDAYIVVVKEGADPRSVAAVAGVSPRYVYAAALNGFAATLDAGQLTALRHNPQVDSVEQDQRFEVTTTQTNAPWHLDRIDQRTLPLSTTYTYYATGAGVYAYIIDTGLQANHPEFDLRAANVYDAFGGTGADCNGHGTHVGGIVGSRTYGVAKGVCLRGVRALDCNGSGTTSGIIAAVDWVRLNAFRPAVANMSIGGAYSSSLNTAVNNLANAGIFVSVASGNSASNACNYSPASAANAMTVAGSTSTDSVLSTSNSGSCVDIYAPGSNVTSVYTGGTTRALSGSSMAAPHAAGVAALYKSTYGDVATSTVSTWIINNATTGVLTGVPAGTPNRLLYKGAL
jgi:subtilisin family serine protease